ncbi:hypothetical protein P9139_14535 [Curtobacterium flaccumfaciens]|nr:hypothetical protein P9139_14535 [Curtobacterium flaccumfaciens]
MELITELARAAWLIPRMQAFGTIGGRPDPSSRRTPACCTR